MNILFISPASNPLSGNGSGSFQRTNLLFEAFARLGAIDIIAFQENVHSDRAGCEVLYSSSGNAHGNRSRVLQLIDTMFPISQYSLFPKNAFRKRIVHSFIEKKNYDIIVCRYLPEAMSCGLMDYSEKLVVDIDDSPNEIEELLYKTTGVFKKKVFHWYRSLIIGPFFKRLQSKCRVTFYSNPEQAVYMNSVYLPNIPFYDYTIPPADFDKTGYRILFVGDLNYSPNSTGIDYFIDFVFPMVRSAVPTAELHIAGKCNQKSLINKWEQTAGVSYMGYVEDLKEEYAESRVVIVPIYEGAGTNIKVLEAMKMRRPCVTTLCGSRGFNDSFSNGVELFISDSYESFACRVVDLLTDSELNHSVASRAFNAVTSRFSRKVFNETVENSIKLVF